MAKDIEKLIEEFVVPEMEYSAKYEKHKPKTVPVTIDDVPEVVLPKTKAEMYNEAKGRLGQKTIAVSRRKHQDKAEKYAKAEVAASAQKTVTRKSQKPRVSPTSDPVWVGSAEELVPFAWRKPLVANISRPNKFYRLAVKQSGSSMLPVHRGK